jgi:hypothetical protein
MSTIELFCDDQQWPSLASSTVVSSSKMKQKGSDDDDAAAVLVVASTTTATNNNDWEILDDDLLPTEERARKASAHSSRDTSSGFVVVEDDNPEDILNAEQQSDSAALFSNTNRRDLRHSVSSPILTGMADVTAILSECAAPITAASAATSLHEDMDESFSMVSDVASVWTAATTSTAVARSTLTVSFRDAILLSTPDTEHTTTSYRTVAASSIPSSSSTLSTSTLRSRQPVVVFSPQRPRSRIQPKIVVAQSSATPSKHMRRCSKSTGDLLRLTIPEELDVHSSSGVSCAVDQLYEDEVYYRKSMGATSRMNGLKLRPDEAQRKEMILFKKERQRQLTASSGKHRSAAAGKAR